MNNLTPELINKLLRFAIRGYWSALSDELSWTSLNYGLDFSEAKEALKESMDYQNSYQNEYQSERLPLIINPHEVSEYMKLKKELSSQITQLTQELATERETTQQAFQASQEWHESQKQEIIAEWKTKLTSLLNSRKTQIQQEITLIKEILAHDM